MSLELSEARVVGQVLHPICLAFPAEIQSRGEFTDPDRAQVSSPNLGSYGIDSFIRLGLVVIQVMGLYLRCIQ